MAIKILFLLFTSPVAAGFRSLYQNFRVLYRRFTRLQEVEVVEVYAGPEVYPYFSIFFNYHLLHRPEVASRELVEIYPTWHILARIVFAVPIRRLVFRDVNTWLFRSQLQIPHQLSSQVVYSDGHLCRLS